MRRAAAILLLAGMLFLAACDTGPGMDLRLFIERFNREFGGQARLDVTQFWVEETDSGLRYAAFVGHGELIAAEALHNGRIHTVTLTGLPDAYHREFYAAARNLLAAFAEIEGDAAERMLQEISVGALPVLGMQSVEREEIRLSYAANEAGRYFRLSCLRQMPPGVELPTLREFVADAPPWPSAIPTQ